MEDLKVGLIAIAQHEELYIVEWIEYYKNLGICHIFLCDNNESTYANKLYPIVKPYVDEGFLTYCYIPDTTCLQTYFYQMIYKTHREEFDYLCVFDIDEFLWCKQGNIIDFLNSNPKFKEYQSILVNWIIYDDNEQLYYENKPVLERFTTPAKFRKTYQRNNTVKSIYNCHLYTKGSLGVHRLNSSNINDKKYCNVLGEDVIPEKVRIYNEYTYNLDVLAKKLNRLEEICHLKHFYSKTIEEFATNKSKRTYGSNLTGYDLNDFFKWNEKTDEKIKIWNEIRHQSVT